MASAGRCAYFYRLARPLPLGAGDYVRPAGIGSACGEGVGGIVEVLLSIGSSSFHLFISVVIVSLSACFAAPRRSRRLVIAPALPPASVLVPCVLVLPLIASLPVLAISRAGRSLPACSFVEALVPSSCSLISCPRACLPPLIVPRSFSSLSLSSFSSRHRPCPRLARVSLPIPLCSSCLPVLRQA